MDVFAVNFVNAFKDVDELIFCLFLFSLPFGWSFSIILLLLFLVSRVILLLKERGSYDKKGLLWGIPLLTYFIFGLVSVLYSENSSHGMSIISSQLSLLLIPLLVGVKPFSPNTLNKALNWFVLGNVVTGLIAFLRALVRSFNFDGEKLTFYLSMLNKPHGLLDSDVAGFLFWGESFSTFIHPAYWGMMILFAFSYMFYRYFKGDWENNRWVAVVVMAFLLLLIICNGTNGITLAFAVLSVPCIIIWWHRRGVLKDKIMIFPIVLVALAITLSNPQTRSLVRQVKADQENSLTKRVELFKCMQPALSSVPVMGHGIGDVRELLQDSYIDSGCVQFAERRYNAHNQFLETYLGGGIVGLLTLISVFIVVFVTAFRARNYLILAWGLIILSVMLTENVLFRYNGIVFIAVSYMLIRQFSSPHEKEKDASLSQD